jgi:hypothetical protein
LIPVSSEIVFTISFFVTTELPEEPWYDLSRFADWV